MKAIILKSVLPPLFFFILYMNLNYFIFSFEARHGYLSKKLNKMKAEVAKLKDENKATAGDKRVKAYEQLSIKLKNLENVKETNTNSSSGAVNIYQKFNQNNLTLLSEKSIKARPSDIKEIKNLTTFTLMGNYADVVKILKTISESELVPISFTLVASIKEKTRYSISVWNRNE